MLYNFYFNEEVFKTATLNIVLIEPQIPQNTGNIVRTCAATGCRLHLVKPFGFKIDDRKLKRAGLDYWKYLDITMYESLEEFLKLNVVENMHFFTTKAQNVYSDVEYSDGAYLVFGREDAGLPEELLKDNPKNCVRFPMGKGIRSLNMVIIIILVNAMAYFVQNISIMLKVMLEMIFLRS